MPNPGSGETLVDGSLDFSGGVNSVKVTTIASQGIPNGLARNELAWLVNATVRDGGILQRTGWQPIYTIAQGPAGLYQGGYFYDPIDGSFPYLILNIGGETFKVDPNSFAPVNLTTAFAGTKLSGTQDQFFYTQAEDFLVIQVGDAKTNPLFWDGNILRQSRGLTNNAVAPGTPGVNEIPPATCMDYYMGRLWYAQGRTYSAGDIVGGSSGTSKYGFRDAVLNVTENPLCVGGDGFTVPDNAGNIRALYHTANLNTQLGQGPLFVGTRKAVYQLTVPVTRSDWIAAGNSAQPLQTVAQLFYGPASDRSIVKVNADAYYQTIEPAIRSFFMSLRNFGQFANTPISSNIDRVLSFNNRGLMRFGSGVLFDNRMIQTQLPMTTPQGTVHQALAVLDFEPVSSWQSGQTPTWEGIHQGLNILQLFTADFGGLERMFAIVVAKDQSIQLWELTDYDRNENGDNRVTWMIEFPAYTWGQEYLLKRLATAELWIDKLYGTVVFQMDYRPDGEACWYNWFKWKECSARNSCEDLVNPVCYPLTPYREGFRQTVVLPEPKQICNTSSNRPSNILYQCQPRLTVTGWCRVRGLMLHAYPHEKPLFHDMVC